MSFAETDANREPDVDAPSGDPVVDEETDLAAQEAAAIGGSPGVGEDADPAYAPVDEAGGGEAEGFEQSEELLIDQAEHGESGGNPLGHQGVSEQAEARDPIYGEADHAVSQDEVQDEDDNADGEGGQVSP